MKSRLNISIVIVLFLALLAVIIFWWANAGSRPGPDYEVLSGGGSLPTPTPYLSYDTVKDEGTPQAQRRNLNFIGPYVTCGDNSPDTDCTFITPTPQPTATPGAGGGFTYVPPVAVESGGPRFWSAPGQGCRGTTTQAVIPDNLLYTPYFTPVDIEVDQIRTEIFSASTSGTTRIGIYESTGEDWQPDALIVDAGTVDNSTTGMKTIDLSPNVTISAGAFLVGFISDETTTYRVARCLLLHSPLQPDSDFLNVGTAFFNNTSQAAEHTSLSDPGVAWDVSTSSAEGQWLFVELLISDPSP